MHRLCNQLDAYVHYQSLDRKVIDFDCHSRANLWILFFLQFDHLYDTTLSQTTDLYGICVEEPQRKTNFFRRFRTKPVCVISILPRQPIEHGHRIGSSNHGNGRLDKINNFVSNQENQNTQTNSTWNRTT